MPCISKPTARLNKNGLKIVICWKCGQHLYVEENPIEKKLKRIAGF